MPMTKCMQCSTDAAVVIAEHPFCSQTCFKSWEQTHPVTACAHCGERARIAVIESDGGRPFCSFACFIARGKEERKNMKPNSVWDEALKQWTVPPSYECPITPELLDIDPGDPPEENLAFDLFATDDRVCAFVLKRAEGWECDGIEARYQNALAKAWARGANKTAQPEGPWREEAEERAAAIEARRNRA